MSASESEPAVEPAASARSSAPPLLVTSAVLAVLRAVAMGSKLLLLLYMGRALSAAELGVYGIFTSTATFVLALVGLEYHQHAVRALLQGAPERRGSVVLSQVRLYLFTYTAAPFLIVPMFIASRMPLYCAGYLLAIGSGVHLAQECQRLLTALSRPITAQVIAALANGAWVFPVLLLGWLFPGHVDLRAILGAWAVGAWAATLLGIACVRATGVLAGARFSEARPDWRGVRSGLVFLVSALCFFGIDTIDRYALEWFRSTAEVGVYTFHASIARSHRDMLFVIAVVPILPLLIAERANVASSGARKLSPRFLPLASLGLGVVLLVAIHVALVIAHKPMLRAEVAIFYLLLAGNVALGLSTKAHYALYAAHRETLIMAAHLCGLFLEVLASFALVPRFGIKGAALANALALFSIAGVKYLAYARSLGARAETGSAAS